VAARLSQGRTSARPGTGGSTARLPVATTTARRAVTSGPPATCTFRVPASRPLPRSSRTPWSASQRS
jgi:hypothetical protein